MNFLRWPELEARGLRHGCTLRSDPALTSADLPKILQEAGLPQEFVMGEQTHGAGVAVVSRAEAGKVCPGVDALITAEKNLSLVVRGADCGLLWLHCAQTGAIGLVHSGRKGTEAGVVRASIRRMKEEFGAEPGAMMALLGPCIRPPHYEVNFAGEIVEQLQAEGVGEIVDAKLCTAADPKRFYSYRADKGKTGRHFGLVAT